MFFLNANFANKRKPLLSAIKFANACEAASCLNSESDHTSRTVALFQKSI